MKSLWQRVSLKEASERLRIASSVKVGEGVETAAYDSGSDVELD